MAVVITVLVVTMFGVMVAVLANEFRLLCKDFENGVIRDSPKKPMYVRLFHH